jgi:alkylation response protein AidB-like acyl-CoA dehydrogenase
VLLPEFEHRVRAFFEAHCPPKRPDAGWGVGDDSVVGGALRRHVDEDAEVEAACAFQRDLYDAGLAWLTGPAELGGAALASEEVEAFWLISSRYERPDTGSLMVGQHIVAPAIARHGTVEQQKRWLPAIWRGDLIGCQLFSEPDAGSDLASLRTRATRDGVGWRVNGQKVWSSGARYSHIGELLARTAEDPNRRHRGLSMFIVDMATPGITVRPLQQMTGGRHFCEVYFDDVHVDEDCLLGCEGEGWAVAQTSLTSERDGFGEDEDGRLFIRPYERLVELAQRMARTDDATIRDRLVHAYTRKVLGDRLPGHLAAHGPAPVVHASLVKLFSTASDWRLAQLAASVLGPAITADDGQWGHFAWAPMLLGVSAPRIAGGTDEIQRNIVGERGLGLPRDPR